MASNSATASLAWFGLHASDQIQHIPGPGRTPDGPGHFALLPAASSPTPRWPALSITGEMAVVDVVDTAIIVSESARGALPCTPRNVLLPPGPTFW